MVYLHLPLPVEVSVAGSAAADPVAAQQVLARPAITSSLSEYAHKSQATADCLCSYTPSQRESAPVAMIAVRVCNESVRNGRQIISNCRLLVVLPGSSCLTLGAVPFPESEPKMSGNEPEMNENEPNMTGQ